MYPIVGVALYILVYHLNPEQQWWGHSIQAMGLRTSLTIAIATVLGLIVRRPRVEPGTRMFSFPVVAMLLLALLAVVSLSWGGSTSERGLHQVEKFIKIAVFVLIMVRCVQRPEHYHLLIGAWLLGVFYIGYQAWGNVGVQVGGRLAVGIGGPDFAESSDLAVHLIATLPLIGAMFFIARRWWMRLAILLTGALTVNTIIMTRTRNAMVGLAAISIAAVFLLPRKYRVKGVVGIIAGGLLSAQLVDPGWWERMATITHYQTDASATGRLAYWRAAVQMVGDHPLGIGIGNFHTRVLDYIPGLTIVRSAHNTFLECLAEMGFAGFAILLIIVIVTLARLGAIRRAAAAFDSDVEVELFGRRTRFHLGWHAMALQTGLVGYVACGMFTTRLFAEDFWILLGLGACLNNVAATMMRQSGATSSEDLTPLETPALGLTV
jgi:probable O-glycosylation ligase (exosortase A-associated)